mmetsp:Transcript_381/g.649  ORF Transcript_381/g.649 Transcript_381/m.649 type:complete len:380 (+) Transcript_381:69-1208(+)
MKFEQIQTASTIPGWVYIDYKGLKKIIASMREEAKCSTSSLCSSPWFESALMSDIAEVNDFFVKKRTETMEEAKKATEVNIGESLLVENLKKLHKYAILNYLAVLKIVKKHDKHFSPVHSKVLKSLTQLEIYEAVKTPKLFEGVNRYVNKPDAPDCAVCLEPCTTPVSLSCGHEFCWICLWKGDVENHSSCPLCRTQQSLNPSERNINDILGGFSAKYFPRSVEEKVGIDRDTGATMCPRFEDENTTSSNLVKPILVKPVVIKPSVLKPTASKNIAKPCVTKPCVTKPSATKPSRNKKVRFKLDGDECRATGISLEVPSDDLRYNTSVGSISHLRTELSKDLKRETSPENPLQASTTRKLPRQRLHLDEDAGCIFQLEL